MEGTAALAFLMVILSVGTTPTAARELAPLMPYQMTGDLEVEPRAAEQQSFPDPRGDIGSGSGSGMVSSFPEPSQTIPILPSTPTVDFTYFVIIVELAIGHEEFQNLSSLIYDELREASLNFTNSTLNLEVIEEESNETVTVIQLHYVTAAGVVDNEATVEMFKLLKSDNLVSDLPLISQYLTSVSLITQEIPPPPTVDGWYWAVIFISVGIALTAVPISCHVCHVHYYALRRKKDAKKEEFSAWKYWRGEDLQDGEKMTELQNMSREELIKKVSRLSFKPRGPVQSHLMTVEELEELVSNPAAIITEYDSIPPNMVTMAEVPAGAEEKNRYKDVLPNPQTRVPLFLKFGVQNSDYINANFIRGYQDAPKAYIATQGPLYWTTGDFWRMVWEQKSSVIIMVTNIEERGAAKCARYWADDKITLSASFDNLEVIIKWRQITKDHTTTIFLLKHKEKMVSREVTHFWFTGWPDHGVPTNTRPVINFLLQARKYFKDMPGPAVVHCSAGIGRTGVFIGADIGMRQLEETEEVDILKIVSTLRQDRGGMVQTRDQYLFLHRVLLDYARTQLQSQRAPSPLRAQVMSAVQVHTVLEEDEEEEAKGSGAEEGGQADHDRAPLITDGRT